MAGSVSNFNIRISVDSKTGQAKIENFGEAAKKSAREMKHGFTLAKASVVALAAAVVLGARDMVKAFQEQRDAERNVEATIKSTGSAAGVTAQELKNMASELQKVTNFGDETTLRGQAMLLTFTKIGKDVFPQATEAMLNLAQKMGGDVNQAAIQLGKALNDPVLGVTNLRRVGIQLTTQQEQQIKQFMAVGDAASAQKVILGEMETQFGGLARAMADPAKQLGNFISDIKEQFGGIVMQVITPMLPLIEALAGTFSDVAKSLAPVIAQLTGALVPVIKQLIPPLTTLVNGIFKALQPVIKVVFQLFQRLAPIFGRLAEAAGSLVEGLAPVVDIWARMLEDQLDMLVDFLDDMLQVFIDLTPAIVLVAKMQAQFMAIGMKVVSTVIKPIVDAIMYIIKKGAEAARWIAKIFGGGEEETKKRIQLQGSGGDNGVAPPIETPIGPDTTAAPRTGKAAPLAGSIPAMEAQLKLLESLRDNTVAGSEAWANYTLKIAAAQAELDVFKRIAQALVGEGPDGKGISPFKQLAAEIALIPGVAAPAIDATVSIVDKLSASFENVAEVAGNVTGALGNIFAENFEVMKGIAVAETVISTSAAIMKTLQQGGVWALPLAISVGALGAAQIANILSTKPGSGGGGVSAPSGLAQEGSAPSRGGPPVRRLSLSGGDSSPMSFPQEIKLRAEGGDLVGAMQVNTRSNERAGV